MSRPDLGLLCDYVSVEDWFTWRNADWQEATAEEREKALWSFHHRGYRDVKAEAEDIEAELAGAKETIAKTIRELTSTGLEIEPDTFFVVEGSYSFGEDLLRDLARFANVPETHRWNPFTAPVGDARFDYEIIRLWRDLVERLDAYAARLLRLEALRWVLIAPPERRAAAVPASSPQPEASPDAWRKLPLNPVRRGHRHPHRDNGFWLGLAILAAEAAGEDTPAVLTWYEQRTGAEVSYQTARRRRGIVEDTLRDQPETLTQPQREWVRRLGLARSQ